MMSAHILSNININVLKKYRNKDILYLTETCSHYNVDVYPEYTIYPHMLIAFTNKCYKINEINNYYHIIAPDYIKKMKPSIDNTNEILLCYPQHQIISDDQYRSLSEHDNARDYLYSIKKNNKNTWSICHIMPCTYDEDFKKKYLLCSVSKNDDNIYPYIEPFNDTKISEFYNNSSQVFTSETEDKQYKDTDFIENTKDRRYKDAGGIFNKYFEETYIEKIEQYNNSTYDPEVLNKFREKLSHIFGCAEEEIEIFFAFSKSYISCKYPLLIGRPDNIYRLFRDNHFIYKYYPGLADIKKEGLFIQWIDDNDGSLYAKFIDWEYNSNENYVLFIYILHNVLVHPICKSGSNIYNILYKNIIIYGNNKYSLYDENNNVEWKPPPKIKQIIDNEIGRGNISISMENAKKIKNNFDKLKKNISNIKHEKNITPIIMSYSHFISLYKLSDINRT